jgi:hypothetical protein
LLEFLEWFLQSSLTAAAAAAADRLLLLLDRSSASSSSGLPAVQIELMMIRNRNETSSSSLFYNYNSAYSIARRLGNASRGIENDQVVAVVARASCLDL